MVIDRQKWQWRNTDTKSPERGLGKGHGIDQHKNNNERKFFHRIKIPVPNLLFYLKQLFKRRIYFKFTITFTQSI